MVAILPSVVCIRNVKKQSNSQSIELYAKYKQPSVQLIYKKEYCVASAVYLNLN